MSEQEQIRALAQEQAERVVQRLMRRYTADTRCPAPSSVQDPAFRHWLGLASGMLSADLARAEPTQADTRLIPTEVGRQRLCVALRTADRVTALVLADPFDRDHRLWLEARLRAEGHPRTRWYVAPVQALLAFIDRVDQARLTHEATRTGVRSLRRDDPGESGPLHLINALLRQAIEAGATQVHLLDDPPGQVGDDGDPVARPGRVQARIDGVLRPMDLPAVAPAPVPIARVFDYLRSATQRDSHLPIVHAGRNLSVRLAMFRDGLHQGAVLHLPASSPSRPGALPTLDALGHDGAALAGLTRVLDRAQGLTLVISPPGAGRSSTLQALAVEAAQRGQRALLLAEPTSERLADALDQDPDRLLVDDVRDGAVLHHLGDLALSGRPVTLALAAADPWSALQRLMLAGLSAPMLGAALQGWLMQALVRLSCPRCGAQPDAACPVCGGSGHRGRQVVSQWLDVGPRLAGLIATAAPRAAVLAEAVRAGYTGLRPATLDLVGDGLVTQEEADRVVAVAL